MNNIASDTHSSLGIKRISASMFAKLVRPKDVIAFNPELYVRKWLASGLAVGIVQMTLQVLSVIRLSSSQVTAATYARFSKDINFIK